MYYFDKDYLAQYLETDAEVEVFADREWYKLTAVDDLENDSYMIGYDGTGKPHTIDYKEITQVKAYDNIITIDALQDKLYDQPAEESSDFEPPTDMSKDDALAATMGDEPASNDAPTDGPAPDEEEPTKKTPREAHEVIGKMMQERRGGFGFSKNDKVLNIKEGTENYGKSGFVTTIYGNLIQYRTVSGGKTAICVDNVENLKVV